VRLLREELALLLAGGPFSTLVIGGDLKYTGGENKKTREQAIQQGGGDAPNLN